MKPQITKRYAMGDTNSMMVLVHNSSRYSFFLLLYLTLPVLIKTPYILHLWLGIVPEYTVMFLRLVLIVTLINSIAGYTNILYCIKIRISTLYSHVYIYPNRTHCFNSTNMDT